MKHSTTKGSHKSSLAAILYKQSQASGLDPFSKLAFLPPKQREFVMRIVHVCTPEQVAEIFELEWPKK